MGALTTTSYAILSLLAVKPWTTYELSQQMERSVGALWPRAASVVYEEPKRLVERGMAAAETRYTGRRASTLYSITPAGREALARWLAEPGAPPSIEHEAVLKVAFADQGSIAGLRANLAAIRAQAEAQLAHAEQRRREYADTGGPFPDRLPVIALVLRYFEERALALLRWVAWAEEATAGWAGVTTGTGAYVAPGAFAPPGEGG